MRGMLVYYFLNNDAKACLYRLEISKKIEIEHVFQFKVFFHITSNLHASCFIAINEYKEKLRIVLCCFLAITNITGPSSSSNFPTKLVC